MIEPRVVQHVISQENYLSKETDDALLKYFSKYVSLCKTYKDMVSKIRYLLANKVIVESKTYDNKHDSIVTVRKMATQYKETREAIEPRLTSYFEEKLKLYESLIPDDYLDYLVQNHKPDLYSFIVYSYLLMPNLKYTELSSNINNLIKGASSLWDRIRNNPTPSKQFLYYLISEDTGGTGKGNFWSMIEAWAEKHSVKVDGSRVSANQFTSSTYHNNLIVYLDDVPKKTLENWSSMNPIIDGKKYIVENKFEMPYQSRVRSFLIASSNARPTEDNPRRLAYLEFGSTRITNARVREVYKLKDNTYDEIDFDYYADVFEKWLLTAPSFEKEIEFKTKASLVEDSLRKWASLGNREYANLQTICHSLDLNTNQYNAYQLYTRIKKERQREEFVVDSRTILGPSTISATLKTLHQNGLIRKVNEAKNDRYTIYDLSPLIQDKDVIISSAYNTEDIDINDMNYVNNKKCIKRLLEVNFSSRHEFDDLFKDCE